MDDDNITVVTSNVSDGSTTSLELAFSSFAPRQQSKWAYATRAIASNEAIADLGATQIFVTDGMPVHNKQKTTCPLKVALADGHRVMSTHTCDIIIPSLPTTLVGHIVPELSIASLFGIRVLMEAGCTVKFDIEKCVVKYDGKIILVGMKDLTTDLWTPPIVGPAGKTSTIDTNEAQDAFLNFREEFMENPQNPLPRIPEERWDAHTSPMKSSTNVMDRCGFMYVQTAAKSKTYLDIKRKMVLPLLSPLTAL